MSCCCGPSSCSCRIISGDELALTVTGIGSSGNPYVITPIGGGGGGGGATSLTRAAALALIAGSTLTVGGVYIITDGPVIGVAGSTSPTQVTLTATSANEFGLGALVSQTFDNSSWIGEYDIDLSGGALILLEDNLGNVVRDGLDGLLVENFPWGRANVRGNVVTNSDAAASAVVLTGWGLAAAAGVLIADNTVSSGHTIPANAGGGAATTIVDLTGLTGVTTAFTDNEIRSGRLQITTPLPDGASLTGNTVSGGFRLLIAPTGAPLILFLFLTNTLSGHSPTRAVNDMEITVDGSIVIISESSFQGVVTGGPVQYSLGGTASFLSIGSASFMGGVTLLRDPTTSSSVFVQNSTFTDGSLDLSGLTGAVNLAESNFVNATLTRDVTATGALTVTGSEVSSSILNQAPASSGVLVVNGSTVTGQGGVSVTGSGGVTIETSQLHASSVGDDPATTRGLTLTSTTVSNSTATQMRTVDASEDAIIGSTIHDSTVTITGAAGDVGDQTVLNKATLLGNATVTLTNPVGTDLVQNTTIDSGSTLNVNSNGAARQCSFTAGSTFNTGAFDHASVAIQGLFTDTATAANTNTLHNKSFNDIV